MVDKNKLNEKVFEVIDANVSETYNFDEENIENTYATIKRNIQNIFDDFRIDPSEAKRIFIDSQRKMAEYIESKRHEKAEIQKGKLTNEDKWDKADFMEFTINVDKFINKEAMPGIENRLAELSDKLKEFNPRNKEFTSFIERYVTGGIKDSLESGYLGITDLQNKKLTDNIDSLVEQTIDEQNKQGQEGDFRNKLSDQVVKPGEEKPNNAVAFEDKNIEPQKSKNAAAFDLNIDIK